MSEPLERHGLEDDQQLVDVDVRVDAIGALAREVVVEDATLRGRLAEAHLPHLRVRRSRLLGVDLANARLDGAHLDQAQVTDGRLTGTRLGEALIRDTTISGCRADLLVLSRARLERVVLADCDLRECSLDGARLQDVTFERCDLTDALLSGIQLRRVALRGCRIAGVRQLTDLRGAALPYEDVLDHATAFAGALGFVLDPGEGDERAPRRPGEGPGSRRR